MPYLINKSAVSTTSMLLTLSLLAGCANLAPHYERPAAPIEDHYGVLSMPEQSENLDDEVANNDQLLLNVFSHQRLQGLLRLAVENNRDLRVATYNIVQARAQYGIQNAETYPGLQATGSGNSSRTPADLSATGQSMVNRQYSTSLGVTAYELDFFGRIRNLKAQAMEQYLATEQARNTARLSLITEIANTWYNWSADIDRLSLAEDIFRSQEETIGLMQKSFDLGSVSALELNQQRIVVAQSRSEVARLTGQNAKNRNALVLLLGTSIPDEFVPQGFGQQVEQGRAFALSEVPAGLPSDLMLRRPDILQSEHALKAANANIGIARAAFYPSIQLTGSAGVSSSDLSNLFESGSKTWSFAPQINLPIFSGGANQANLQMAEAGKEIAVANYEKAIQTAFREVSDALADRASVTAQLSAQRDLVKASNQAYSLTQARYTQGLDSWLDVLNAERAYTNARTDLIGVYADQLTNGVSLYKVLGGDWESLETQIPNYTNAALDSQALTKMKN